MGGAEADAEGGAEADVVVELRVTMSRAAVDVEGGAEAGVVMELRVGLRLKRLERLGRGKK